MAIDIEVLERQVECRLPDYHRNKEKEKYTLTGEEIMPGEATESWTNSSMKDACRRSA
jgi:hypothetical protein